jgi:hypothetical protein
MATYRLCCVAKKMAISELLLTAGRTIRSCRSGGNGRIGVRSVRGSSVARGRGRGAREASAREESSEVCMERKRSEEGRGESGDGIVEDDEGREREEGQKAGCYSLLVWCGLRSNLPPSLCCIHYCNCTTWTAASISDLPAKTCLLAMFCLSPSATEATLRLHAAPWDPHV